MTRTIRGLLCVTFVAGLIAGPVGTAQASSSSEDEIASVDATAAVPITNRRVCAPPHVCHHSPRALLLTGLRLRAASV